MTADPAKSGFRFEKRRADAVVRLAGGDAVKGCFFVAGSATHDGTERVAELLNSEAGFFPFEIEGTGGAHTVLYHRAHVVLAQDSEGQHELKQLLRAQIKQTLESAGFTDVQVIPTSLLVRTKDPAGSPVTMFINPQSFMAFSVSENHENQCFVGTDELCDRQQREKLGRCECFA